MTDSILRSYQYYSTTTMVPFPAAALSISSPLELPNLVAWFDATDRLYIDHPPTTLATDTQNVVTWLDKSPNAYQAWDNTTYSDGVFKASSALFTGLPVWNADVGTQRGLRTTGNTADMNETNAFSIWIVATLSSDGVSDGRLFAYRAQGESDDFNNDASFAVHRDASNQAVRIRWRTTGGASPLDPGAHTVVYDTPFIFSCICTGTSGTSYINNADAKTDSYSGMALGQSGTGNGDLCINNAPGGTLDYSRGEYAEVILTRGDASIYRDAVNDYLVAKWGL